MSSCCARGLLDERPCRLDREYGLAYCQLREFKLAHVWGIEDYSPDGTARPCWHWDIPANGKPMLLIGLRSAGLLGRATVERR